MGKRISAAENTLPAGGSGGMMERLEMMLEVPLGEAGNACDVNVLVFWFRTKRLFSVNRFD